MTTAPENLKKIWELAQSGDLSLAPDYLHSCHDLELNPPGATRAICAALYFMLGDQQRALSLAKVDWTLADHDSAGLMGAVLFGQAHFSLAYPALLHAVSGKTYDPGAHLMNLGRTLLYLGKSEDALTYLQRAQELVTHDQDLALQSLVEAYLILGRPQEALDLTSDDLNDISMIITRVNLLCATNRHADAAIFLSKARDRHPDDLTLLLLSADVAQIRGRIIETVQAIEQILKREPENISLWSKLAHLGCHHKNVKASRQAANRALELAVSKDALQQAIALNAHAHVLVEEGSMSEAEAAYREALRLSPAYLMAMTGLGNLLTQQGRLNEAISYFYQVRAVAPLQGWTQLINAREVPEDPKILEEIERAARHPGIEGPVSSSLLYTLASAWDKKKDYDHAMKLALEANEASKKLLPYSPINHRQRVDRILATFSKEFFMSRQGWGNSSRLPVFVLGMPRSGTTLTEQILASHSTVFGAGELGLVNEQIQKLEFWELHLGSRYAYPELIHDLGQDRCQAIAREWLIKLQKFDPDAHHVIDKLPHNFEQIGLIKLLFPNAIIFHCRREPRDIAVSNYITDYAAKFGGMGFAYDLQWIGEQLVDHDRLMLHWHELFPGQIFEVSYENLVVDTEHWARNMINFMGLKWEPEVLDFQSLDRPVKTASVWQVRQPVYTTSKDRWKCYEAYLKPLEETLKQVPKWPQPLPLKPVQPDLFSIAMSHMKSGDHQRAIEDFERLLEINQHHAAAHHFLGCALYEIKNYQAALISMRKSIKLHPYHPTWWENLARAGKIIGNQALAEKALQNAKQLRENQKLHSNNDQII